VEENACLWGTLLGKRDGVFDLEIQEFFVSQDVIFHENIFSYQTIPHLSEPPHTPLPHPTAAAYSDEED